MFLKQIFALNAEVARNVFDIEEVWNPNVVMVTKLFSSYCGAPLAESCCRESNFSDTNWPRYRVADLHILKT